MSRVAFHIESPRNPFYINHYLSRQVQVQAAWFVPLELINQYCVFNKSVPPIGAFLFYCEGTTTQTLRPAEQKAGTT